MHDEPPPHSSHESSDDRALARWRLILGRFADNALGGGLSDRGDYARMDRALGYLYGREYAGRNVRQSEDRDGTLDPSRMTVPEWVREVRDLFPKETAEVVQRHALRRYNMTELISDPEVLQRLEPSYELLKMLLTFRGMLEGEVLNLARRIVREVVEELTRRLARDVKQVLWGRLNRQRRSRLKVSNNLDWQRTIRANLKHYDRQKRVLVLETLHFFTRMKRHMPWNIIMAVDLSGSMMDSVIHSAVMAGIFHGLPAVRVRLIAFDTSVVDLSDRVGDPTELLMSVQLGGGTDIASALAYCEGLVHNPVRTILILVTDFFEGNSVPAMIASVKRLREAGVRVLGLAALDPEAMPVYDRDVAQMCVDAGAEVAALTPKRLAEWLERVLS